MKIWLLENKTSGNLLLIAALFLVALSFRLWDINATGRTWDESAYFNAGKIYINNILTHNFSPDAWRANRAHPPMAKYIYGIVNYFAKAEAHDYTASRVLSAVMGALICLIVYFAGREFFERRVGVLAALILAFTPPFVAHNKVAALETPVALFFTLTAYFFLQGIKRKNNGRYLLSAVFCGLAVGTRFNNFLLFIFVFLVFLLYKRQELLRKRQITLPIAVALFPVLAMAVFVASWPWLWGNTYKHLVWSTTSWPLNPGEYFLGHRGGLSLSYYIFYFLGTTPVLILGLCGVFIYKAVKNKHFYLSALTLWFAVPFLFSFSDFKQDGIRYIYQIYPPLALISAIGLFAIADILCRKRYKRLISYSLSSLVIVYLAVTCLVIHPYYLDYYNEIVGGPGNVYKHKWFEIGWWGEGIKEAVDYLNKDASPNSCVQFKVSPRHEIPPLRSFLRSYSYLIYAAEFADRFSVKWKGKLKVDHEDNYTFYTQSDDGVKLWIDNRLIISDWQDHGVKENKGNIVLTKGMHDIELQFYENEGAAVIRLLWSSSHLVKSLIPSDRLYCTFGLYQGKGLVGQYYNGCNFDGDLIMAGVDPKIDFDWGHRGPTDPQIDYVVVNTHWEWYQGPFRPNNFEKVYTVDAAGAPLVTIYQKINNK